jgi:hypothetical protein
VLRRVKRPAVVQLTTMRYGRCGQEKIRTTGFCFSSSPEASAGN